MIFSLHAFSKLQQVPVCYFKVHIGDTYFSSPFYADEESAMKAMETLILKFRKDYVFISGYLVEETSSFTLALFGKKAVAATLSSTFELKSEARTVLTNLRLAAQETSFEVSCLDLASEYEEAEYEVLSRLLQTAGDQDLSWEKTATKTLKLKKKKKAFVKPSIGLATSLNRGPCDPLFSLFQPYLSVDYPLFHGRKQEVEDLYSLSQEHDLLLLYGLPRVGKSSLIQCGLVNRMEAKPGEVVVNRRGQEGMLSTLYHNLATEIKKLSGEEPAKDSDLLERCLQLQDLTEQNLLLVFDELETIFQPATPSEEREEFFDFLRIMLADDQHAGRVILSMREAYLAPLADYEESFPGLLDNRYHLHPLSKDSMADVSINMLDAFQGMKKLTVEEPEIVADQLSASLADENGNVPFHCMQIYLSEMHQTSCARSGGDIPVINSALMSSMGPADNVIQTYLDKQIRELETQLSDGEGGENPYVRQQIDELAQSRQQCGCKEPTKAVASLAVVAATNEKKSKDLRGMLWLALLGLLLSLLTFWWMFGRMKTEDPCLIAEEQDSCVAYINYLCNYGEDADCAVGFREKLELEGCEVWEDYKLLLGSTSCAVYQDFYEKYESSDICTDHVREMLLDWECPIVRDTVQLTVRDTIIDRRPSTYGPGGPLNSELGGISPPCLLDENGNTLKKVGPLWVMTDPLAGGPYNWLDALDACQAVGMRLPCIGEVDFLISEIYRGEPGRAYDNLSGSGACYLINPSEIPEGRISFWTGTEANDALSWSFYFDIRNQNIGREANIPKTARLPCLCVKKDPNAGPTGLPPCYNKSIDRVPAN